MPHSVLSMPRQRPARWSSPTATRDVQGIAQVVGSRRARTVGPEEVHDALAMQAMVRAQCQQLDEVSRLTQPPGGAIDGLLADDNPEFSQ